MSERDPKYIVIGSGGPMGEGGDPREGLYFAPRRVTIYPTRSRAVAAIRRTLRRSRPPDDSFEVWSKMRIWRAEDAATGRKEG